MWMKATNSLGHHLDLIAIPPVILVIYNILLPYHMMDENSSVGGFQNNW